MRKLRHFCLVTACLLLTGLAIHAQVRPAGTTIARPTAGMPVKTPVVKTTQVKTRVLFLLDASGSMANEWQGTTRIQVAKNVLKKIMDSLQTLPNLEVGLRVYGSQSALGLNDCKDTRLEAPIRPKNAEFIKTRIDAIATRGITPIAYAMQQVVNDFGISAGPVRNVVVLITDGIESCNGNPCEVSLQLQKKGVMLNPFIIGMGMQRSEINSFDCMGRFYDATNAKTFKQITANVMNQITNITTTEVRLMDQNNKPTETNVPMTFYDATTGQIRYNYVHTLNLRGTPDTLSLDPINIYDLTVHTTPPVTIENINLTAERHNIISVPAPQGDLALMVDAINTNVNIPCLISREGKDSVIAIQETGTTQKYLTGKYKVELLTLPRLTLKIEIVQSKTTTVKVPASGLLNLINANPIPVLGSIYEEQGRDIKWLVDIGGGSKSESITLQPGNYRLVYRTKASKKAMSTQEKRFKITPGSSESFKLN